MSGRTRLIEADLFSTASLREPPSPAADPSPKAPSTTDTAPAASLPRYLLPKDLQNGIRQLADQKFDRLLAAVLAEQKRRRKKLPVSRKTTHKPASKEVGPPLTLAKLNAIRAAFKAGVAPSRIARQFGISHADVRKALASGTSKRASVGTRGIGVIGARPGSADGRGFCRFQGLWSGARRLCVCPRKPASYGATVALAAAGAMGRYKKQAQAWLWW
jgi:hypothetical protein